MYLYISVPSSQVWFDFYYYNYPTRKFFDEIWEVTDKEENFIKLQPLYEINLVLKSKMLVYATM